MGALQLRELRDRMDELIRLSGEINLAVARTAPTDYVVLMNRVMLWLTLAFAFDAFVQRASDAFGTSVSFVAEKKRHRHWPDTLVRLKILEENRGVSLHLPQDRWESVVGRHYGLRNKWAHDFGVVSAPSDDVLRIACWDPATNTAWISECGWSEFRDAVESLANQVLAAAAP